MCVGAALAVSYWPIHQIENGPRGFVKTYYLLCATCYCYMPYATLTMENNFGMFGIPAFRNPMYFGLRQ